ncbi:MAG: hypothetical protein JRJ57_01185 [Deltaproteobacteria bacterium]|nr:hypothetical protein [Deltaproteobacteria bacterium]
MRFDFLAKIINENWFQHVDQTAGAGWTFYEDLRNLKNEELKQLVFLLLECTGIKIENEKVKDVIEALKLGEPYIVGDMTIDKDMIFRFLVCITLSEYRIDNLLLHPSEMRSWELEEICQSIGLPKKMVTTIYFNWHSGLRKKVMGENR